MKIDNKISIYIIYENEIKIGKRSICYFMIKRAGVFERSQTLGIIPENICKEKKILYNT